MIFREGRKVAARSKILGIHSTTLASLIGSNRWVMIININIITASMILIWPGSVSHLQCQDKSIIVMFPIKS